MGEYSREELLHMLETMDAPTDARMIDVRGAAIAVDDAALKSWAVVSEVARIADMDGLHATVALMAIVTRCTDLDEDGVLALAGGHDADFGEVAEVLGEIVQAMYPKG